MNKCIGRRLRIFTILIITFLLFNIYTPICFHVDAQQDKQKKITISKAECVMELNTRRVLYETGADVRLPMASTTKILTAATVLSICKDIKQEITVPDEAVGVEGSSVYLQSGDVYTVEDLLYGLMLRSGNDCATALALHCAGSIDKFSIKMNEIALKAGAIASHFCNPHGLPSKNHYTTARDLTLISCYAMENPVFKQIVGTKFYEPQLWKNKNKMLMDYQGTIGVKTGYTKEAGRCLVTAAERDGLTLVCSVLSSPMMYERSAQLLDDAFAAYSYVKLLAKSDVFEMQYGKRKIKVCARDEFCYPLLNEELQWIEIQVLPIKDETNKEIVGQIQISLAKRLLFSGNLYKL